MKRIFFEEELEEDVHKRWRIGTFELEEFDDILKLLLSAGYFRARVDGPSMFDKVREKKKTFGESRAILIKNKTDTGRTLLVYCSFPERCRCKYFVQ